jgi:hypothetical protein
VTTRAPWTRTLPAVLREQLATEPARLIAARVVAVPDGQHVRVDLGGEVVEVPRLASYTAAVGDAAQLLSIGSTMLALGAVK